MKYLVYACAAVITASWAVMVGLFTYNRDIFNDMRHNPLPAWLDNALMADIVVAIIAALVYCVVVEVIEDSETQ